MLTETVSSAIYNRFITFVFCICCPEMKRGSEKYIFFHMSLPVVVQYLRNHGVFKVPQQGCFLRLPECFFNAPFA